MRIVFNLRLLRAGQIGGLENVARRLAAGLASNPLHPAQQLVALCPDAERDVVAAICPWTDIVGVAPDEPERRMSRIVRRLRPDLLLCPLLVLEPSDPPCPSVAYLPDLQHETFPELFPPEILAWRRKAYADTVRRTNLLLTTSEYARGTILKRYPEADPGRVVVVYPGVEPEFLANRTWLGDAPARLGLPSEFLLYPANFWPHKNHPRLLQAMASLKASGETSFLALTGAPSSGLEAVEAEVARLGLGGHVAALGRVSLEDLVGLVTSARAVVFPSLYEGFGLPILEAFHRDTPVLCSNVASCPEVAADAALLVDPTSVEALADGIRRIWTDADLRADLVAKGRARRAAFCWDRTMEIVRSALRAICLAPAHAGRRISAAPSDPRPC